MARLFPPRLAFLLTLPIRRLLTPRDEVLTWAGVTDRSVVLEVGAGNGYFTEALAKKAKKVIAVELQEAMAEKLYRTLRRVTPHTPIEIRVADIATLPLPPGSVDISFLYYSFHEIRNAREAAANIARALRPGGTVAIAEPKTEVSEAAMEETIRLFSEQGLTPAGRTDTRFSRKAILHKSGS